MLLELTLPPSLAIVAAIWMQRVKPTAERVTTLESELAAMRGTLETQQTALVEAQRMIDRLADQRMG